MVFVLTVGILMKNPFEQLISCPLALFLMKLAFLVRKVSELAALRRDPTFLKIFNKWVVLYPTLDFLPKIVSVFHLAQEIVLPVFLPKPSLHAERATYAPFQKGWVTPTLELQLETRCLQQACASAVPICIYTEVIHEQQLQLSAILFYFCKLLGTGL